MAISVYQRCTDPSCTKCLAWFGPAPTEVRTDPIFGWNTTHPHADLLRDMTECEEWDGCVCPSCIERMEGVDQTDDETDMPTRGHDLLSEEI